MQADIAISQYCWCVSSSLAHKHLLPYRWTPNTTRAWWLPNRRDMQSEIKFSICFIHVGVQCHVLEHPSHLTWTFIEPQLLEHTNKQTYKWMQKMWEILKHKTTESKKWRDAMVTYWGVSVGSAWAGMGAYLIDLCRVTCGPHKLHDGHKHGNDEPTDQHDKDAPNVLHAQTWGRDAGDKH